MFDNNVWTEDNMLIDAVNDGRHKLPNVANGRESIPYIVVLPEHQIALFTYTWVTSKSEAGAAFAVFGPGVGNEPIQQGLPDRPVPKEMNFDAWEIEGFRMEQDLKFDKARVRWKSDEAEVDFQFEAFHPPYAYGSDPRGCPSYCATDRIEQAGLVKGTLKLGEKVIKFEGTGHRDHSWGTRDWIPFQQYEWFVGQVDDKVSVHFWRFNALGKENIRGYVFKDGKMSRIATIDNDVTYGNQFWQESYKTRLTDEAERETLIEGNVFGCNTLAPDPKCSLNESGATVTIDGQKGVGWMECCWPTEYLEHIRAVPQYVEEARN
ncbi:hypothetical protein A8B75_17940 [Sphingomonadales bacterium EhC05]|nr:hypothetical protein A8B75_17940 [Sphingomonadales bacterium EhC05]